jgi:hypothetical protein
MYVLTLLLKNEIDNLKNPNNCDDFLNDNSPCKYLLSELRKKNDIKNFFKSIIYEVVENLELKNSETKLNFDLVQIKKELEYKIENQKKQMKKYKKNMSNMSEELIRKSIISNITNINNRFNSVCLERENEFEVVDSSMAFVEGETSNEIENDEFTYKYLIDLLKSELEKKLEENKNDSNMTEFINIQIEKCKANKSIFINKNLCDNLYQGENSKVILDFYKKDFMKVIECIDKMCEIKSWSHPNIRKNYKLLRNKIENIESLFECTLTPAMINSVFWNYFVPFLTK